MSMADARREALESGRHLFQQLQMRDVAGPPGGLAIEMDNRPELANIRGALQGGLVATLIDVAAGRLAWASVPEGYGTATADMTVHFLAPIIDGPARAEATIIRPGKRIIVCHVDVWDVGRHRLAATSTITFAVLEPRPSTEGAPT